MLVECENCGAPLDVGDDVRFLKCGYCGVRNRTRRMKTIAVITPAAWVPPVEWTPPDAAKARSIAMKLTKTVGWTVGGIILMSAAGVLGSILLTCGFSIFMSWLMGTLMP